MEHNLKTLLDILMGINKTDNALNYANKFVGELQNLKQFEANEDYKEGFIDAINLVLGEK